MHRTSGIVNLDTLRRKHVVIFGLGSVGGYIANFLPYPLASLTLVDTKVLQDYNVERHLVGLPGVGRPKVEVVKEHLLSHHGIARSTITALQVGGEQILNNLRDVDLVIDATSNSSFRQSLNIVCTDYGWPAVYAGVYAGGSGWEVVSLPHPEDVCYQCFQLWSPPIDIHHNPTGDYGLAIAGPPSTDLHSATGLVGAVGQAAGYASQVANEILMGRWTKNQVMRHAFSSKQLTRGRGKLTYKALSLMIEIQNRLGVDQFRLVGDCEEFTLMHDCGSIPVNIRRAPGCSLH